MKKHTDSLQFVPATVLADFYKITHRMFYPEGTTKIYSTWIPRSAQHFQGGTDYAVAFGYQMFIKKYLINYFNEHFFNRPLEDVISEYKYVIENTLGGTADAQHLVGLHKLGYLPIKIKALPEGTRVPIKIPALTIENTLPEFYWLTNYLETLMSSELWMPSTSATTASHYRDMLNWYAVKTTGSTAGVDFQGHDFSLRGMAGIEAGIGSGMGHLLSFLGTDNIPAIVGAEMYYNEELGKKLIGSSVPACYDDVTEVLTNSGFKLFKDLSKEDLVAQYYSNGEIDFVKPMAYYNMPYKGNMISFETGLNNASLLVTPNHKMVRVLNRNNKTDLFEASNQKNNYSNRNRLPVSGNLINTYSKNSLSAEERLRIAFQADGAFMNRKDSYNGERTGMIPIRFSLKKDRKKERLVEILKALDWEYSLNKYDDGYYSFYIKAPAYMDFKKDFNWIKLDEINLDWGNDFLSELTHWDGHHSVSRPNNLSFASTVKSVADKVQAIAHLSGNKSTLAKYTDKRDDCERKDIYTLSINIGRKTISGHGIKRDIVKDYDSTVHCVTVPTHMLIVRRNDMISISGNTEHSIMSSYGRDELNAFTKIIDSVPEGIVSIVSDTYDFWNVLGTVIPSLKEKIMTRNGTVSLRPDTGIPEEILCGTNPNSTESSTPEEKGAVEMLWDIFGGTVTEQGYKVLDSHIGLLYGDAITLERANKISELLMEKGFASTNVTLGIGSYTYQFVTRDSLNYALKATYTEVNGEGKFIEKDPATDKNKVKKSLTGKVAVVNENGKLKSIDHLTSEDEKNIEGNLLQTIFKDGKTYNEQTFSEIKNRLYKGE